MGADGGGIMMVRILPSGNLMSVESLRIANDGDAPVMEALRRIESGESTEENLGGGLIFRLDQDPIQADSLLTEFGARVVAILKDPSMERDGKLTAIRFWARHLGLYETSQPLEWPGGRALRAPSRPVLGLADETPHVEERIDVSPYE